MYSVHAIYKQCTIILQTVHDNLHEFPHVYFSCIFYMYACLGWVSFPAILLYALIYGRFTCTMKHACMKYLNMSIVVRR